GRATEHARGPNRVQELSVRLRVAGQHPAPSRIGGDGDGIAGRPTHTPHLRRPPRRPHFDSCAQSKDDAHFRVTWSKKGRPCPASSVADPSSTRFGLPTSSVWNRFPFPTRSSRNTPEPFGSCVAGRVPTCSARPCRRGSRRATTTSWTRSTSNTPIRGA